jgi:hypothetical protein
MKRVVRRTFALLALVTMALGADNTLGAWKYNVAKSKAARGVSPITNLTVTREPADGGVKITAKGERADGTKIDTVTTVKYDDKQVSVTGTGLTWDMTAIEQVNGKTLTEERWKTGGKYHTWVQTVVSKNGGTMTSTSKGTDAVGKSFTSVAVFDRQ